jgi:hypothetical protein
MTTDDRLRTALEEGMADALTVDWPGDTRLQTAPAIVDYLLALPAVRAALGASEPAGERETRRAIGDALGLLNSMVASGESHSDESRAMVRAAFDALTVSTAPPPTAPRDEVGHPFKDEWSFQRSMPGGQPIFSDQPCFICTVPFAVHDAEPTAPRGVRYIDTDYLRSVIDGHLEPHGAEDPVYRSGKEFAFRLVKTMVDEAPALRAAGRDRWGRTAEVIEFQEMMDEGDDD